MSFSVNTNAGAMTALQYLNQTQGQLNQTQNAINSGLKVASAKDNGAVYAIAQNQRASVAGYQSVINSLNNGSSSVEVALSAGQSISDLLIQMKAQALSAADTSIDTVSRQALNANFQALMGQITTIVKNATTWPSRLPCMREKVTNARFAALSISSTHMNITIALRRNSTPAAPIVNSSMDRYR